MTTTTHPDVPLPAGATYVDDWQASGPETPYRFIGTPVQHITEHLTMWTAAVQYADGSIDDGRIQAPSVMIGDWHVPNDQVRELISVLQTALAQVEQWETGSA